jgi:hypothetical protein
MTPSELQALPVGSCVTLLVDTTEAGEPLYESGSIMHTGATVTVSWDDGAVTFIDTASKYWTRFIADMAVAPNRASGEEFA